MARTGVVLAVLTLVAAACSAAEPATTTSPITATSEAPATTAAAPQPASAVDEPKPLRGTLLEPGVYMTTSFQPTVQFRLDRKLAMSAFQGEVDAGLQNRINHYTNQAEGIADYKGVTVHNWWLSLTPAQIVDEIEAVAKAEWGTPRETEFDGFDAIEIEGTSSVWTQLWIDRQNPVGGGSAGAWNVLPGERVRVIVVDTPAGPLLITVQAQADEWDDFLPLAEEILAGISFPDMEDG